MKIFSIFLAILFLIPLANSMELFDTFSQGDKRSIYVGESEVEIKLLQVTNFNAVFSLNGHLIPEIGLGETKNLQDKVIVTINEIFKENGRTYVKANFEFPDEENFGLEFLNKPISHAGASISSEANADINVYSKKPFYLAVGQEKLIVDLQTSITLLGITESTSSIKLKNDNGLSEFDISQGNNFESIGVRVQLDEIHDNRVIVTVFKSTEAVLEEHSDEIGFFERFVEWFNSIFSD